MPFHGTTKYFSKDEKYSKVFFADILPWGLPSAHQKPYLNGHALIAHPVRQRFPRHPWRYNPSLT